MPGSLCLVLHAHLPFVRHPEHERFLEETWLFEAVAECYLPLLANLLAWERDGLRACITLTLSPTLCAMLRDDLLKQRCRRYLLSRVELAESETERTAFEPATRQLADFYVQRFTALAALYDSLQGDLIGAFRRLQEDGRLEIITSSATHAVLPLLSAHWPSVRAQLAVAREEYRECFGRDPLGIWLPECAYVPELEPALAEAGLKWFILDSHGVLHAHPQPRYGLFAPVLTRHGLAVFGRDVPSARQVWSQHEGYPGDAAYRDFYRDIGYDLDYEYLRPYLYSPERGFTGIKYHHVTGKDVPKGHYDRNAALARARVHAEHFLEERLRQLEQLSTAFQREPVIVSPYDAELFGHWWYEGPEFLDALVRTACARAPDLRITSPREYLSRHLTVQRATPAPSSWGEEGHWRVWLNERNEWIWRQLRPVQKQMTALAQAISSDTADGLTWRALQQAAREVLLAQSSDWPFILRTDTSPEYARRRVEQHLSRFTQIAQWIASGRIPEVELSAIEAQDNLFPNVDPRHFR